MARQSLLSPLPTRNGLSPSCVALPAGPWVSVLDFLCDRFSMVAPDDWLRRMEIGEVVDEFGLVLAPDRPFKLGLRVFYYRDLPEEVPVPFEEQVLFQDDLLVVADKPHFLPVTPSGRYVQETLLVRLKRKLGIDTLSPIHRIDRETAGLVIFCIQPATRGRYQKLFAEKRVEKQYEAIAPWRSEFSQPFIHRSCLLEDEACFMQMREDLHGVVNTETRIEAVEYADRLARYRLSPLTGRKHQLRAHCAALGIPILHDRIYPELLPENSDDHARPLQLLARQIAFRDPVDGSERCFESRLSLMPLEQAEKDYGAAHKQSRQ